MPALDVRLRVPSPELLALPWRRPLADWDPIAVGFRDIPVGPSRHLVRFVEADHRLWALKALPRRVAVHEYEVLGGLEARALAAVRPAGVVVQPRDDDAVLVTRFLERSWQYRRLLLRIPPDATVHRARLFDAMATLLVDLHRNGIWWGDCSLANTLFTRDGQVFEAWFVDAETAEASPSLGDRRRDADLEIMVENVAGGLVDLSVRRGEGGDTHGRALSEAEGIVARYAELWALLHDRPSVGPDPGDAVRSRVRHLEDVGFAVDEVRLQSDAATDGHSGTGTEAGSDPDLRLSVAVGGRRFHAEQLRALTGLDVGEGQARILLGDLRAHRARWEHERGHAVPEVVAAREWLVSVFGPGVDRAHDAVRRRGDPVQAYCDLLEVRWLLSEQAGHDVGDGPALDALVRRIPPGGSAAEAALVDLPTEELPIVQIPDPPP